LNIEPPSRKSTIRFNEEPRTTDRLRSIAFGPTVILSEAKDVSDMRDGVLHRLVKEL